MKKLKPRERLNNLPRSYGQYGTESGLEPTPESMPESPAGISTKQAMCEQRVINATPQRSASPTKKQSKYLAWTI